MDQDENKEKSNPSPSKNKKKSHGLCNILALRKKRVGCLPVSSDNSVDSDECSGYARRNVQNVDTLAIFTTSPHKLDKKSVSEDNPLYENGDNLISKRSEAALAKSNSTTNIALCCAITESSRTPLHFQSDFKIRYDNMKATGNINRRSILTRMNGHHSEELHDKLPPTGLESKLIKPSSDTNISNVRKTDAIRRSLFSSKNKKTHKRSFSLGKTVFSSEDNKSKDSEKTCIGSSQSCEISPQSSPSPVETSHTRLRRRLLLSQRRSADNIVASSSGSSPVSTRSVPDSKEKKKKIRPSSVILLSGQEDKGKKSRDASMDSLARQSLLAAQVLHLIPTDKARERNFLHGRIAANSLLGSLELERVLPQREVRIYIATWNMNGQAPPAELNSLVLPEGLDHLPDILAIGTQESYPERFQWEVSIQETLGPSHVLFHSAALGTLHLAIYMRRDLLWFCSVAEDSSYSVRPGTAFRTKGAVAIGFSLFGTTFLFITAHLTAHQDKVKERLQDIKRIAKSLELPKLLPLKHKNKDVTQNFDCVFWSGDLNFRLTQPREEVLSWISSQQFPLSSPPKVDCLPDQLTTSILDGTIFRGFEEGPLTFAPTYKYDPGSQTFDSSHKQRTPSYTDRILFKSRKNSSADNSVILVCLSYASVPSVCTSDHKPVWGLYKCVVRPGIDTIPLAAGMFNREVYLEAIKRRAAEMDLRGSTSAICTIQPLDTEV